MKLGIASDHGGYALKSQLIHYLQEKKYDVVDCGTDTTESVDYPQFAFKLGKLVSSHQLEYGIAICSSGIGISIACNKVPGIRCAKVATPEEAYLTRLDNDANILALSGKLKLEDAIEILNTFLTTEFSNAERHIRRIGQITEYERTHQNEC